MPFAPMDFMTPEERWMLQKSGMLSDAQLKPPALGPFNVSPQIDNAPAPQFMPMEQPGNSFLDRLATAIGQAGPPPVNRFDSPRSQALQSLVGGLATGFAGKRQQSMDERQSVQDSLREITAARNERAIVANETARSKREADRLERGKLLRATQAKQAERAAEEAGYLPVPSWVSRAIYGDDSQTGKRRKDTPELIGQARLKIADQRGPGGADGGMSKQNTTQILQLSDNVRMDPDIKDFVTVRDNYERIRKMAKSASGVGDLSVIFAYMKVLDPTSVVREAEYNNAAEAIGKLPQLQNVPNNWISGKKLTPAGRQGFINAAKDLYDTKHAQYLRAKQFYENQAKAFGVDPGLIIRDYTASEDAAPDGYEMRDGIPVRVKK